jgi:transcription termination/antitermination protein NusA
VGGVTEEMIDKLGALGMVSVFDVEEVGAEVLMNELAIDEALAQQMVEAASTRAKVVAEQQQKDKELAEIRRREEEEAARRLLAGEVPEGAVDAETAAAAILGAGSGPAAQPSAEDEARAADILGGGGDQR